MWYKILTLFTLGNFALALHVAQHEQKWIYAIYLAFIQGQSSEQHFISAALVSFFLMFLTKCQIPIWWYIFFIFSQKTSNLLVFIGGQIGNFN